MLRQTENVKLYIKKLIGGAYFCNGMQYVVCNTVEHVFEFVPSVRFSSVSDRLPASGYLG